MSRTRKLSHRSRDPYEPSPRDIRRACEQIQATWSERETKKRSGRPPGASWCPPNINWDLITDAADESQSDSPTFNGSSSKD